MTAIVRDTEADLATRQGGYRYATAVGGTVTGLDGSTPLQSIDVQVFRWNGSGWNYASGNCTDASGQFSVTWPNAGRYWLETSLVDDKTSVPQATQRRVSYVVTLEVLPQ